MDLKFIILAMPSNASFNSDYEKITLNNVLIVPGLKKNILSIEQFIKDNQCSFIFNSDSFVVKKQANKVLARGHRSGNLCALEKKQ